jgi:hypothetical protein
VNLEFNSKTDTVQKWEVVLVTDVLISGGNDFELSSGAINWTLESDRQPRSRVDYLVPGRKQTLRAVMTAVIQEDSHKRLRPSRSPIEAKSMTATA